jgi:hypothetical protein
MRLRILLGVMLAALTAGCGYSLVGRGIAIDPTIKRIGVPTFLDATGHPGLDQRITEKVIEELLRRGRFDVVPETTGVDAVVRGELTAYAEVPVGFGVGAQTDAQAQASQYRITVRAKVRYSKVGEKEPIWQNDAFNYSDTYDVSEDTGSLVDSDQAVERLASQFARQLVADMLEAF